MQAKIIICKFKFEWIYFANSVCKSNLDITSQLKLGFNFSSQILSCKFTFEFWRKSKTYHNTEQVEEEQTIKQA